MKGQRIFPGIILIGFGLYFFRTFTNSYFHRLLYLADFILYCRSCLSHSGLLWQRRSCHSSRGHIVWFWSSFSSGSAHKSLAISFWYFYSYYLNWLYSTSRKTKSGMFYGITLCILSIFILFYDKVTSLLTFTQNIINFWPFVLMAFGVYVLFF